MIRKSNRILEGIKGKNVVFERKSNNWRHHITPISQEKIDMCLSCEKPPNECKGNCVFKK